MTIETQPAASTASRPKRLRRKVGPLEAAARKARVAARKTPVWNEVAGLADAAVALGFDLDGWDDDVPGKSSTLREYSGLMKEVVKYSSGTAKPDTDDLEEMKALIRNVGKA